MIPNINPNNNLLPNSSVSPTPSTLSPISPALAALNQERRHEAPSLDDRVSKKNRTTPLTETVHYPLDDAGESYEGGMLNGKYHGVGHLINKDGSSYKGGFKEGLMHGKGILLFAPSATLISCEGEFLNNDLVNGTIRHKNGCVYSGSLKNKKPDGQGTLTYPDGRRYIGEFKDDMMTGCGTLTYPDGTKYSGEFKDGKMNGSGTYTFSSGEEYIGEFKDDMMTGWGTLTYPDGEEYIGEFKDDMKNGSGTISYPNGSKFSGKFKDDKKNGWGVLTGASGQYEGHWEDDFMDINNKSFRNNVQKLS